jgi:putative MATE family efflux protein
MTQDLTTGDIKTKIKSLAIPAAIGFLFHTMYNVTDTFFAGTVSTQALASLSISFPIFVLMLTVSTGMSSAVNTMVSNSLGKGTSKEDTSNIAQNALAFALTLSLVVTTIGLVSTTPLMSILGASGAYLISALSYIDVVVSGTVVFIMSMFINSLLNAQGDMVSFRNILIVTFFLNILFDYIAVTLGFGIQGIAYATVTTETVALCFLSYKLYKTNIIQSKFKLNFSVWKKLLTQGVPPTTNVLFMSLGTFITIYYVSGYGESVVAAFGVGMKIEQLALMPIVGINIAVLTMVAQNNGAKEYERIEQVVKSALIYSFYISLVTLAILWLFPSNIVSLFSNDMNVIKEGTLYLRVEAVIVFAFAVIFIHIALLQGIERPKFIFYLSLARQIIFPSLLLGMVSIYTDDIFYIWLAIASIAVLSAIVVRSYAMKRLNEVGFNK